MDRHAADVPSPPPAAGSERTVRPSAEHAELALREAAVLMAPIARWLLRHGVTYPAFADMLKGVFVAVARQELEDAGRKATHSALSVLSGVHRKDVRALETLPPDAPPRRSVPLSSAVFTRWITDPRFLHRGQPRALPRHGTPVSFETLARESSNDVHPRTLLDELVRSGLARLEGDTVVPLATSFVPSRQLDELTALFSANVSDHIAAAVHNLTLGGPKFLEQSVFAQGLPPPAIERLHHLAREAWAGAFTQMVAEARQALEADGSAEADGPERLRMRFGVYFYAEPVASAPPAAPRPARPHRLSAAPAHPPGARRRRRTP